MSKVNPWDGYTCTMEDEVFYHLLMQVEHRTTFWLLHVEPLLLVRLSRSRLECFRWCSLSCFPRLLVNVVVNHALDVWCRKCKDSKIGLLPPQNVHIATCNAFDSSTLNHLWRVKVSKDSPLIGRNNTIPVKLHSLLIYLLEKCLKNFKKSNDTA